MPYAPPHPLPPRRARRERRRHGRFAIQHVVCSLGEVRDVSTSGLRIERRGRRIGAVGDALTTTLKCGRFALPVDVRIVRIEKSGLRRHTYGLAFEEPNPAIQAKIRSFARADHDQRMVVRG